MTYKIPENIFFVTEFMNKPQQFGLHAIKDEANELNLFEQFLF